MQLQEISLRKSCHCGSDAGFMETRNGQDCVFCSQCKRYQYNAPKHETGRSVRSVSTVHALIKPKQRSRIIDRSNGRCERCGKSAVASITGLQVGHILSVDDGLKQELPTDIINSDDNLLAECDECNLGHGKGSLPIRLFVAMLMARTVQNGVGK